MMPSIDARVELRWMEEACRQTRHQLDLIERQIIRKMTALIPSLAQRRGRHHRSIRPEPEAFLCRYRSNLAAITTERQPDIDALSNKLARQAAAVASFRARIPFPLTRGCACAGQQADDNLNPDRSGGVQRSAM
jgi:hypothetical protein